MAHGPKCLRRWKATGKARGRAARALAAARKAARDAGLRPGAVGVRLPQWDLAGAGGPPVPGVVRVEVAGPLYAASAADLSPATGRIVASCAEQEAVWFPLD